MAREKSKRQSVSLFELFYQAEEKAMPTTVSVWRWAREIYGSTFFMLSIFHGMQVTVGSIMLQFIGIRSMKGR